MNFFDNNTTPLFKRIINALKYPLIFILILWVIQTVNYLLGQSLNVLGVLPRELHGLIGIFTSNFLHGGWDHLMGNTPILLLLGFTVGMYGPKCLIVTSVVGSLIGGILTWLFGSPAYHVGASLLIFVLWGAIIGFAIFQRKAFFIIVSLILVPIYGLSFVYGLVPTPQVSFIGHLGGFIGGLIVSRFFCFQEKKKFKNEILGI